MTDLSRRLVVAGAISTVLARPALSKVIAASKPPVWTMTKGIPNSHVRPATRWLLDNYEATFQQKIQSTPVTLPLLCAIACQESAYTWFDRNVFKQGRTPAQMMRLLVLDNVQSRGAFPQGTDVFRADRRFGDLAPELIKVSDESRIARGYRATGNLLYGYGLFQYDLQNIVTDPGFWHDAPAGNPGVRGLWGDVAACTDRLIKELTAKIHRYPGDLHAAVAAYNGRGPNARRYAEIVLEYADLAKIEVGGS